MKTTLKQSKTMTGRLDLSLLFKHFRVRILLTWLLVAIENLLWALVPLFIGRAIDALLEKQEGALVEISLVMFSLIFVSVGRRIYDTRSYGTMRVHFGSELVSRTTGQATSKVNARLDMSREMVDFLEEHVPELLTSVVQVIVAIVILWSFDPKLGISALAAIVGLALVYALFHKRFFVLNANLNSQMERQVSVLEQRQATSLFAHLKLLRKHEIRLSDTEAVLFGAIYAGMFAFMLTSLWFASSISAITAGMMFAILSYTWELIDSGVMLPVVLQQWSRLSELRERFNSE
ncbi:MAG: ABC transporter six-transmembrane domain-containing protein [Pseudomonadota bacterium]